MDLGLVGTFLGHTAETGLRTYERLSDLESKKLADEVRKQQIEQGRMELERQRRVDKAREGLLAEHRKFQNGEDLLPTPGVAPAKAAAVAAPALPAPGLTAPTAAAPSVPATDSEPTGTTAIGERTPIVGSPIAPAAPVAAAVKAAAPVPTTAGAGDRRMQSAATAAYGQDMSTLDQTERAQLGINADRARRLAAPIAAVAPKAVAAPAGLELAGPVAEPASPSTAAEAATVSAPASAPLAPGQLKAGNLNPLGRTVATAPNGQPMTTQSISIEVDGNEVVIPTVVDGKKLSNDEAIARFEQTGENFGTFKDVESATTFAKAQSAAQGVALDAKRAAPATAAPVGAEPASPSSAAEAATVTAPAGSTAVSAPAATGVAPAAAAPGLGKPGPDFGYLSDPVRFNNYMKAITPHMLEILGAKEGVDYLQGMHRMQREFLPQAMNALKMGDKDLALRILQNYSPSYHDIVDIQLMSGERGEPNGRAKLMFGNKGSVVVNVDEFYKAMIDPTHLMQEQRAEAKDIREQDRLAEDRAYKATEHGWTEQRTIAELNLREQMSKAAAATTALTQQTKRQDIAYHQARLDALGEGAGPPKRPWASINTEIDRLAGKHESVMKPVVGDPTHQKADPALVGPLGETAQRLARWHSGYAASPATAVEAAAIAIEDAKSEAAKKAQDEADTAKLNEPSTATTKAQLGLGSTNEAVESYQLGTGPKTAADVESYYKALGKDKSVKTNDDFRKKRERELARELRDKIGTGPTPEKLGPNLDAPRVRAAAPAAKPGLEAPKAAAPKAAAGGIPPEGTRVRGVDPRNPGGPQVVLVVKNGQLVPE